MVNAVSDSFIQELFAERIGGNRYGKTDTIYKFEKIKRAKKAAKIQHPDLPLIDMGVGEPDEMAFPQVIETLQQASRLPENRGYADNGCESFKKVAAHYMERVFQVSLDPQTEIIHSIGSKSALSILPAAFINPGDVALMTIPGYPVFGTHAKYYGGEVFNLPLKAENHFLPDLASIPLDILERSKVLVLNYPNNPTGASATRAFFQDAVDWARRHNIIIIQDAAYAALIFEGQPLSILQAEGAKDVAIELHSLSKGFNMTGWRIGFVCGNPLIVKAYGDVKDNTDSGQFLGIQKAAETALQNPEITAKIAEKYSRRMDLLVGLLREQGFQVSKPAGSFFLYLPAPKEAVNQQSGSVQTFSSGEDFSQWLIREELISTVPWDEAGPYVRFSVTFEAGTIEAEHEVVAEIKRRLGKYHFKF
ncbi:MAG: LL-diaminopimelate aminotransferase [Puniceicoccaceae bacterium]